MKTKNWKTWPLVLCAVLIVGCTSSDKKNASKEKTSDKMGVNMAELKLATVNTDSLFDQYLLVGKMNKEMEQVEKKLQNDLQNQTVSFKKEYENYLKVGSTMTLNEQKRKEEYLTQKQQRIVELQQKYSEQIMQMRAQKMQEVQDKVFGFIEKYNKEHGQYNLILSNARTSGVLYAAPSMDITTEVIKAINEEYNKTNTKH
ncbi:MAG: OmpH family outer membrane protein [Bacteroidales bacterium]